VVELNSFERPPFRLLLSNQSRSTEYCRVCLFTCLPLPPPRIRRMLFFPPLHGLRRLHRARLTESLSNLLLPCLTTVHGAFSTLWSQKKDALVPFVDFRKNFPTNSPCAAVRSLIADIQRPGVGLPPYCFVSGRGFLYLRLSASPRTGPRCLPTSAFSVLIGKSLVPTAVFLVC